VLSMSKAFGQTAYNPFTQNIHFSPEPTAQGFECNSLQNVEFICGLTTIDDATDWQNNPMKVVICITGFTFNGAAVTAITGPYASNFNWAYSTTNPQCVIGTQNKVLPGTGLDPFVPNPLSTGLIRAALKVGETSPISTVLSVNASLEVPPYMATFNSGPDDNEATQTQTYCSIKLKGNVYNDVTTDGNVNGPVIHNPAGNQLYANLVTGGKVVGVTPIKADGSYEFPVNMNTTYNVVLSITQGVAGNLPPSPELPLLWVPVNEDCCDNVGTDFIPDGKVVNIVVTDASVVDVNFGIKSGFATPLVLDYFYANENECATMLSWSTAQEQNTEKVEVLRNDGENTNFKKIATVQLAGNSTSKLTYSYVDHSVKTEVAYQYVLHFIDRDGKSYDSDIRSLTLNCGTGNTAANLAPNPATNETSLIYITDTKEALLEYELVDVVGRTILEKTFNVVTGMNVIKINLDALSAGTYYLNYREVDGTASGNIKFVKQ
jgi:hypothetical protein